MVNIISLQKLYLEAFGGDLTKVKDLLRRGASVNFSNAVSQSCIIANLIVLLVFILLVNEYNKQYKISERAKDK